MKEFNYKRAWRELARTEWEQLPPPVRDLVWRTNEESANLVQNENLDMPWPRSNLRECIEMIGAAYLAHASRVVHDFGHWAPSKKLQEDLFDDLRLLDDAIKLQTNGGYWKFSNYADQVLTAKLGLVRDRNAKVRINPDKPNPSVAVHEGIIRVGFSSADTSTWSEIGWANETTWKRILSVPVPDSLNNRLVSNKLIDRAARDLDWEKYVLDVKAAVKKYTGTWWESFNHITNLDSFMEEENNGSR